jgi:hypothetical protein
VNKPEMSDSPVSSAKFRKARDERRAFAHEAATARIENDVLRSENGGLKRRNEWLQFWTGSMVGFGTGIAVCLSGAVWLLMHS